MTEGRYKRTRITLMRAAKTRAETRYNLGGRPKKQKRTAPSLPKFKCLDGSSDIKDVDRK